MSENTRGKDEQMSARGVEKDGDSHVGVPSIGQPTIGWDVEDFQLNDEEFERKYGQRRSRVTTNPASILGGIEGWIILNAESLGRRHHKALRILMIVAHIIATMSFIAVIVMAKPIAWAGELEIQQDIDRYWFRHNGLLILNLIFASLCFAGLLFQTSRMSISYVHCHNLARKGSFSWAPKRRSITEFALCRQVAQTINVLFWLLQNAYVLGRGCAWFDQLVNFCTLVQWSCFNFVFILDTIWAECLSPWLDEEGRPRTHLPGRKKYKFSPDPLLIDEPLSWRHVYKVVLGLGYQAIIIYYAVYIGMTGGVSSRDINEQNRRLQALGTPQCYSAPYNCKRGAPYIVTSSSWIAMAVMHAGLTFYYVEQAQLKLATAGPYCLWERPHKMLRTLQSTSGWVVSMGIASMAVFFTSPTYCATFLLSWLGILPLQIVVSAVTLANSYYYFPRTPRAGDVVLQAWLRELVWTAEETSSKRSSMIARAPSFREVLEKEPVFAFDVAAKLLLWSDLVYTVEEKNAARKVKESNGGWCGACGCCPGKGQGSLGKNTKPGAAETSPTAMPELLPEAISSLTNGNHNAPAPCMAEAQIAPAGQILSRHASKNAGSKSSNAAEAHQRQLRGIRSFKLATDGYLEQQVGSADIKIEVGQEVASPAQLDLAMRLFGLTDFEVIHEESLQTKVLLGWSDKCIVLAFRGTASAVNAWSDLKIWRLPHPPTRGRWWLRTQPLVHGGFLQSWMVNNLHIRVLDRVREIIADGSVTAADFRVFLTGHSLGGALATLAAIDIQRELHLPGMTCHTFGAPRTGNHSFASEYEQLVPDTWHLINDRDAVPRLGKLGIMYKRPGQRVLINRIGDCRVRPDHIQVSLHTEGFSVREHLLAAYRAAIAAILKSQLMPLRAMEGGEAAVYKFAADDNMSALARYLGLDLEKLLKTPRDQIKIKVKQRQMGMNPFSRYGFLNGLSVLGCRLTAFLLGEAFAEGFKAVLLKFFPKNEPDGSETETSSDPSEVSHNFDLIE